MIKYADMRVHLFSNGVESFVSPFVGGFTGAVCLAMATSLKAPRPVKSLRYDVEGDQVRLQIDGVPVPLDKSQGFAETIVRDTLRGMIRHLKGIDPEGTARIDVEIEGRS